ncbi:MAG: hypothetical protein WDN06_09755 [Asticcacaulis sp.]
MRQPYHLSYPSLIRDGGEIYMLPEAHRSGKLTLYRAERFPDRWAPAADIGFPRHRRQCHPARWSVVDVLQPARSRPARHARTARRLCRGADGTVAAARR